MLKAIIDRNSVENKKILWLASLRGLAVFLVFFSHLNLLHMPYTAGFMIGRIGVVIFFLISGYLALGAKENRTNYQYILNRFFRIYPIYWLMLVLRVVVAKFEGFTMGGFLLNLTAFSEFFRVRNIIGSSWMLPIMVIFFFVIGLSNKKWGVK